MIRYRTALKLILSIPINFLLTLMSLYRPVQLVRFRTNRIGHLALNTETFLRRLQLESGFNNKVFILFPDVFVANQKLYDMYKAFFKEHKNIVLIENRVFIQILKLMYRFTNKYSFNIEMNSNEYNIFANSSTNIEFSKNEKVIGNKLLKELGIQNWYICIFARDSAYLKTVPNEGVNDYTYHDFRDADIDDFELAIKYIIDQGGYVVRLGNIVNKKMNFKHKHLIDYPFSEYRSDFMDLFLISQCKFVLATTSGATDTCAVFNIPRAGVNWIPIDHLPWTNVKDIGLAKKIKKDGEYIGLTKYNELIKHKHIEPFNGHSYKSYNIDIEDNNPEEILDICIEMYQSLNGSLKLDSMDEVNQKKYQEIHKQSSQFHEVRTPMSYSFLRHNKWFLKNS